MPVVRGAEALEILSDVAREQAGMVTVAQAKRRGIPNGDLVRMADRGQLRRVLHGVYALPGGFSGPREQLIAIWLRLEGDRLPWERGDPGVCVSHASAAALYDIGTFMPAVMQFTVPRRRNQPADPAVRISVARLGEAEWQWVSLPEGVSVSVTTPERTIVDLAYAGEERDHVLDALADARQRGLVDTARLREALATRTASRGRGSARWLAPYVERG